LSSETYSRKYEKLPNIDVHACNNITEKNEFVKKWVARKFGFVSLRFDPLRRNSWIAWLQSVFTIDSVVQWLGARGSEFNIIPGFCMSFYVWYFVVFVWFYFPPKTHFLSQNFSISFAMLIYLVYLTFCKTCDRL